MRLFLLTSTIFLLSFIFANNPPASQTTDNYEDNVVYANTYSEFEMYLNYIRTRSKCMYGDAITISMYLEQDTNKVIPSSWEDLKLIIDENKTSKND